LLPKHLKTVVLHLLNIPKTKKPEQEESLEKKLWKAADKLRKNIDVADGLADARHNAPLKPAYTGDELRDSPSHKIRGLHVNHRQMSQRERLEVT